LLVALTTLNVAPWLTFLVSPKIGLQASYYTRQGFTGPSPIHPCQSWISTMHRGVMCIHVVCAVVCVCDYQSKYLLIYSTTNRLPLLCVTILMAPIAVGGNSCDRIVCHASNTAVGAHCSTSTFLHYSRLSGHLSGPRQPCCTRAYSIYFALLIRSSPMCKNMRRESCACISVTLRLAKGGKLFGGPAAWVNCFDGALACLEESPWHDLLFLAYACVLSFFFFLFGPCRSIQGASPSHPIQAAGLRYSM
jgi:hypothetical protein